VTFNVDMSSEGTVPAGDVRLAGSYNGWDSDVFSLPNVNGNIHSATLRLPTPSNYPVTFEYKYVNNGNWETLDAACATVNNTNRVLTLNNSGDTVGDVFNGCNFALSTEGFITNSLKVIYNKTERVVSFFGNGFNNEVSQIQVFDITGRTIKTIESITSINDFTIDFQSQTNGLYFVRIESNGRQLVKRFIVY